jgi:molybdate transport system substrate-binding protein
MAGQLKILSAGAVKPGLTKVADSFQRENGATVDVTFATAPAILQRMREATLPDAVIAPTAALEELTKIGKCSAQETATLGRIGVGVFVRSGRLLPQISTVETFKASLLRAESIVYNQASTGAYLKKLFESLSIAAAIEKKSTIYPDFAAVLNHVSKGQADEIGFGAATVIIESENRGVKFVGALPAEIQNYTSYAAAATVEDAHRDTVKKFIHYLATPAARSILTAAGIE